MRIILAGDGRVGYTLAQTLAEEDHDVTVIDKSDGALARAADNLDVLCMRGNAASGQVLREAGVERADVLIAVTGSDELNMLCCLLGRKLGAKHRVARIRDINYAKEINVLKENVGLDLVVNPEEAAAKEIYRSFRLPAGVIVESFADGKMILLRVGIEEDSPIAGKCLADMGKSIPRNVLFLALEKGDMLSIPTGTTIIDGGDVAYILGEFNDLIEFFRCLGKERQKVQKVMVVGGGRLAYHLLQRLEQDGLQTRVIEIDEDRCLDLNELLPKTLVIKGDGTDQYLLESEQIADMDAFIALTGRDEDNLMIALYANYLKLPRVLLRMDRSEFSAMVESVGITASICPKDIAANQIARFVRHVEQPGKMVLHSLYKIAKGAAEVIELEAELDKKLYGKTLSELHIADDTLLALIIRNGQVILPRGHHKLEYGDRVIVVTKMKNVSSLQQLIH